MRYNTNSECFNTKFKKVGGLILNKQYEITSRKMELVDYIYYLQYQMEMDDITVETKDAVFMVWESSTFKVNGEEFTTEEFCKMLSSQWKEVTCNGVLFKYKSGEFVSVRPIETKTERIDNVIRF